MRCLKCGGEDIHKRYDANKFECSWSDRTRPEGEHLHYYCRECAYDWTGPLWEVGDGKQ